MEFAAASESVAVESLGIDRQRDVGAGEVVFVDMAMQMHTHVDALARVSSSTCTWRVRTR